jgi:hypothetical protein
MFSDTPFMSSDDKYDIAKQMRAFLENNMKKLYFKKQLYNHLVMRCGFTSQTNLNGYYHAYFGRNSENRMRWAREFVNCQDLSDYKDINTFLKKLVGEYMDRTTVALRESIKDRDIKQAKELMAKHGFLFLPQTATNVLVFQRK